MIYRVGTLSELLASSTDPTCSARPESRELDSEQDDAPTPTHNEEQCEICQLHLQHLRIPKKSNYPNGLPSDSLGAAPTFVPSQSFEDGVKLGLRLQKESDDVLLNQYRKRLQRAEGERDISRRYQYEMDRLERELAETKDMLLAVQISYEESVEAHIFAQPESHDSLESPAFYSTTENNVDSASQLKLSLDGAGIASDLGKSLPIGGRAARDDEMGPDSVHPSPDTPADIEEDDDDDLFMWEQLKALDEDNKEEFWNDVYNIGNHSTPERRAYDIDSANRANVTSLANTDDVPSDAPRSLDEKSPSVRHVKASEQEDQHSDGEESSYLFI